MAEIEINIDRAAVRSIERKLLGMPTKLRRKAFSKTAREVLKPVLARARSNAPRQSGWLAKSIRLRTRRSRKAFIMQIATSAGWYKGDEYYGAFQEFGWKTGKRGRPDRQQIEGKHFVEEAYQSMGQHAANRFVAEMPRQIDRIMRESGG